MHFVGNRSDAIFEIKNYGGSQHFVLDLKGSVVCSHGLRSKDSAVEWITNHYGNVPVFDACYNGDI